MYRDEEVDDADRDVLSARADFNEVECSRKSLNGPSKRWKVFVTLGRFCVSSSGTVMS
jgi:hypothetical protein